MSSRREPNPHAMGVADLARSEPGLFRLWDLLAITEEIAVVALTGRRIDAATVEARLAVFPSDARFWALQSTRVLLLVAAEVRGLIEDEVTHAASMPVWPPEEMDLDEEAARLMAAGRTLTLMPDEAAYSTETNASSRDLVRQTLGLIAGTVTLSEDASTGESTLVELFGRLFDTVPGQRRRRLHYAADLVFWAAAFLVGHLERFVEGDDGRGAGNDPDAPEHQR